MTVQNATARAGRALLAAALVQTLAACGVALANGAGPAPSARTAARPAARPGLAPEMRVAEMRVAARALEERRLMVPVAGVIAGRVADTFYEARGGGRTHQAVDILAPKGTPVVAADDGRVLRLRSNAAGGITIYAVDPEERFVYYYAHLDRYRDGLAEGTKVAKGEVIGYVGTTGNAPKDTPHLHFQVMRLDGPSTRWWDGTPLDPRPHFALDGARR